MAEMGRKQACTEEDVLNAIKRWKTTSETELAKHLNVGRTTIWRRLQNIPQEQIDEVLQELSETKLKPAQYDFNIFMKIPIIEAFEEKLRIKIRTSESHKKKMLRGIWRACRIIGKHPDYLTVEECADLIAKARVGDAMMQTPKGKKPISEIGLRRAIRDFMQYMKGISGKLLTAEGIDASASKIDPERARARFTPEHRETFMNVLRGKIKEDWHLRRKNTYYNLPFKSKPIFAHAMEVLPYCYYYMGNRRTAILQAQWDRVEWHEEITIMWIIDKGLHKKGRKKWKKRITQELLQRLKAYWEATGCKAEGSMFPFGEHQINAVSVFFKECYKEAGIPEKLWKGMPIHIWRHTACQDLLDATDRNWELVAEILSWESIDTMKKHYGKASEDVITRGMLKAMGIQVKEEPKEFKF